MKPLQDHFALALVAGIEAIVIGCYTALAFVGVDPSYANRLSDVMLALAGALGGLAIPMLRSGTGEAK